MRELATAILAGGIVGIVILAGIGWAFNLYKFVNTDFEPSYKEEVVRGVGIFVPPVGGVVGYFDFVEADAVSVSVTTKPE